MFTGESVPADMEFTMGVRFCVSLQNFRMIRHDEIAMIPWAWYYCNKRWRSKWFTIELHLWLLHSRRLLPFTWTISYPYINAIVTIKNINTLIVVSGIVHKFSFFKQIESVNTVSLEKDSTIVLGKKHYFRRKWGKQEIRYVIILWNIEIYPHTYVLIYMN